MSTDIHSSLRPSYALASASNPRSSPYPPSTPSSFQSQPRQSYDGRTASGKVRRLSMSVDDAAQQRRQDHDRDGISARESPVDSFVPSRLRNRASATKTTWMKRLSSAVSSRSASPAPSEALSADPSVSTTSKTFSHQSSNTPILGHRPVAAPGPNKLVKRTSSQRMIGDAAMPLRRPATSHQRSAVWQQYASPQPSPLSTVSPDDALPTNQIRWRQYFSIKVPKFAKSQKRYATHDGITLQQHAARNEDVAVNIEPTGGELYHPPEQMDGIVPSTAMDENQGLAESMQPSAQLSVNNSASVNDSFRFSLQGLLRGKSSRKLLEHRRPTKLIKQPSRRVVSDPLVAAMGSGTSESERPAKRRHADFVSNKNQVLEPAAEAIEGFDESNMASPTTFVSDQTSPVTTSVTSSPEVVQYHFQASGLNAKVSRDSDPHSNMRSSTASELASTLVESENEIGRGLNLAEDEDTDQSTLFDSLRTRGTRSTSGAYRARIETIFDESPSPPSSSPPRLGDILPQGMLGGHEARLKDQNARIEDESNMATPVRTIRSIRSDKADDGSPLAPRIKSRNPIPLHLSSPPDLQKALSLGTLEYDDQLADDDDESRWSCFDDESKMELGQQVDSLEEQSIGEMDWAISKRTSINSTTTSISRAIEDRDGARRDAKNTLFDWSEQPADKNTSTQSPPRPRTVHGNKKSAGDRGARSTGRRIPSGLHARSQSVPVVPGVASARETVMTNKFGTWGVGSKGVSEDWDEDFDFGDDRPHSNSSNGASEERRPDSALPMHIPQTIRESQANVMTNIGLVREFYNLIEELKSLRQRAVREGQQGSEAQEVWSEIDAMIDLADQEVDDPLFPAQQSMPTSPAHDPDPFDDGIDAQVRPTPSQVNADPRRSRSQRRSVIPSGDNDVFSNPTTQAASAAPTALIVNRPRKDSEAMARSVIEAVQRKKGLADADIILKPVPANKKVPFDTNTLRHIVPYVTNLVRKARASVKTDNSNQPDTIVEQSRLSQLFEHPQNTSPLPQRSNRPDLKSGVVHRGKENGPESISKQLNEMNLA